MSTLRLGLAGCGVITQRTLPGIVAICREFGATVTALCDPGEAALDAVAAQLPFAAPGRFGDYGAMLASGAVDAVLLATPIGLHERQVRHALEAGLHAYCHKTLATTAAACRELDASAARRGLTLAASPGQMLLPAYERAAALVGSGELGPIATIDASAEAAPHRFEAERAAEAPAPGEPYSWEWYHRVERGGGPLADMLVYPLSFLCALFGAVTDVHVAGRLVRPEIHWRDRTVAADALDSYAGLARFGEIAATLRTSFSANATRLPWGTVVLRGADACVEIVKHDDLDYSLYVTPNDGERRRERLPALPDNLAAEYGRVECHVLLDIREFVAAVTAARPVRGATAGNAALTVAAIEMIERSAAGGPGRG